MYGECWFTGKFYFKHGGSQNATLSLGRRVGPRPRLWALCGPAYFVVAESDDEVRSIIDVISVS